MNRLDPWGYHFAVNAVCDPSKVKDPENIKAFSKALVKAIDMVAYGEPTVVHFAEHAADKAGYTLVQLIETSNICAHFVDSTGEMYLDVFSCKQFNPEVVLHTAHEFFTTTVGNCHLFERDAYSNVDESGEV